MEAIEEGSADFAVLPIENSSAGVVSEVYDLLVEFENYIVGEIILPIDHALAGVEGASLDTIRTVYSHPQALMQSAKYLDDQPGWQRISVTNTAVAAKKVLEDGDITQAAICSEHAAQIYGLKSAGPQDQLQRQQLHPVHHCDEPEDLPAGRKEDQHLL